MQPIAARRGVTVAQIALAWLLHRRVVSSVIVGARKVEQLKDNVAASQVVLTEDELNALDQVSALPAEYPGWMFATQTSRAKLLAQTTERATR